MRVIITFHSVDTSGSVISYPPALFSRLISSLAVSPIPVCNLDKLLHPETRHGIALTFDDGISTVFSHALPVLREHRLPAHLFLATGAIAKNNRWPGQPASLRTFDMLTGRQIEACHRSGMLIESHTVNHPDLYGVSINLSLKLNANRPIKTFSGALDGDPALFCLPIRILQQ
jgi:peptidoglycan/xylan/chitin deacetylase (PgdA/CDA1 family)